MTTASSTASADPRSRVLSTTVSPDSIGKLGAVPQRGGRSLCSDWQVSQAIEALVRWGGKNSWTSALYKATPS